MSILWFAENFIFERAKVKQRATKMARLLTHSLQHCTHSPNTTITEPLRTRSSETGIPTTIRSRTQDQKLSEKRLLHPKLSLTKAINQARQSEAAKKQALLRNHYKEVEDSKKSLDAVKVKAKNTPTFKDENWPKSSKPPPKKSPNQPSLTRRERWGIPRRWSSKGRNLLLVIKERPLRKCL